MPWATELKKPGDPPRIVTPDRSDRTACRARVAAGLPSSSVSSAPPARAPSNVKDPTTQPGSAGQSTRSPCRRSRCRRHSEASWWAYPACERTTPLGSPVDPEVNRTMAGAPDATASGAHGALLLVSSAASQAVGSPDCVIPRVSSVITPSRGRAPTAERTRCAMSWSAPLRCVASWTSTRSGPPASTLSRKAPAPYPENSGRQDAPVARMPRTAAEPDQCAVATRPTLLPGPMPSSRRRWEISAAAARSSARVSCSVAPSSLSQRSAGSVSACDSLSAHAAMFVLPPGNQDSGPVGLAPRTRS